ncbi:MAG TPA: efflux RND transporter permease subunit [Gemmatimonadaceae bacterium]|nr:efflux RND transporter permease subunit [Gemmatimonadaceae bacterium]
MFLSDVSIRRPVFATMMMVALVVLGVVGYQRLGVDEYPDVTYPVVIAQVAYPGASPQVMERDVARPIEEALNTVQGVREITATAYNGGAIVRLVLNLGEDILTAQQDVQSKIARIRRQLPPDIEEPIVNRFDPNSRPIISLGLQSAERPLRELTSMADDIVATRLGAVPGVGDVSRVGGATREIRAELDPEALRAYGISPAMVAAALQRENQEVPAGRVEQGGREQLVRVTGRITVPREFGDVTVAVRNGVPVRVSDLAHVVDGIQDPRSAALLNDTPAVAVNIIKLSGANTVEVSDSVAAAVGELRARLPADVALRVIRDDSWRIRDSLHDVQLTLVLGAVLTIAIIYLFLNSWRSTVITGLTLPVSIISSFFVMWLFDFTINNMTLLALSLSIGLLIDDAIVVRENIVRHVQMGKDHVRASREGTSEIGLAVVSTTLAIIAVFIPVAFMGGMIGLIFMQFGVTVAFAVLVSLFVSFTLDPMLSSVWRDPEAEAHGKGAKGRGIRRIAVAFNDRFERIADRYPDWLRWSLANRGKVLLGATASVVIALAILPRLGFSWLPEMDGGEFNVRLRTAPGSSLTYTTSKAREVADLLQSRPEVALTYVTIGGGFRGTPNNGSIYVKMVPKSQRSMSQEALQTQLRADLRTIPGVEPMITGTPSIFGGFRQPIIVNVQGPEETRLQIAADQVLEGIRNVPGVAEPNSSFEGQIPQLDVDVDRQQAWAAGLGIGSIAGTLSPLFGGQRATRWEDPDGYSHDVVVIYPDSLRASAANVASIPIVSGGDGATRGSIIPLAQVAEVRSGVGPQQIERRSLERMVSISAGVLPGHSMGSVADAVRTRIDSLGLPVGYQAIFTGDVQNLEETKGYVAEALILAIVFIYLILASLFGSFTQPLAILVALPLSLIGVALALLITGGNLNVMTMIGIVMLMGLVTKNGILLVDFTNHERAAGKNRVDALLSAGRIRLRPIIMTTAAMIGGMLPLALAIGAGGEQRAPMARAVIGGLMTSTLLTLFAVPVVYSVLEDVIDFTRNRAPGRMRDFGRSLGRIRAFRRTVSAP